MPLEVQLKFQYLQAGGIRYMNFHIPLKYDQEIRELLPLVEFFYGVTVMVTAGLVQQYILVKSLMHF